MELRVLFVGTVESSQRMLLHLIDMGVNIVGVLTRDSAPYNSDFSRLNDIATRHGIPMHSDKNANSSESIKWMRSRTPDVGFCFGWSQILNNEVLSIPGLGFVGFHPALLPSNRGRHPIIWALVLGLDETGSTFFFMDHGADTGDIISQRRVQIGPEDDSGKLYARIVDVACEQLSEFVPVLGSPSLPRVRQGSGEGNIWRKRTSVDGQIDWRMSSRDIVNLVRALRPPYPGATALVDGVEGRVWGCSVAHKFVAGFDWEPGLVVGRKDESFVVKTGDSAVVVHQYDMPRIPEMGEYL